MTWDDFEKESVSETRFQKRRAACNNTEKEKKRCRKGAAEGDKHEKEDGMCMLNWARWMPGLTLVGS